MADYYVLSEKDKKVLQGLINREIRRLGNVPNRPGNIRSDMDEYFTPEVYIARTPTGGIPALTVGSQTYSSIPGVATCDVYRLLSNPDDSLGLAPVADGMDLYVYNLSTSAVSGNTWITIVRDKGGHWIAQVGGVTGSSSEETEFYAMLTGKCYPDAGVGSGTYQPPCPPHQGTIQYSWKEVTDNDEPGLSWGPGTTLGAFGGCFPAYSQQNLDMPVYLPQSPRTEYPNTGEDYTGETGTGGSQEWTSPNNACEDDNDYATAELAAHEDTHYLKLSNFCFGLPGNVVITGIAVSFTGHADAAGVVELQTIKLVSEGAVVGTNKTDSVTLGTSDATETYDFTPTQWGVTGLQIWQANAADFGVVLQFHNNDTVARTVSISHVSVAISFTPSGAATDLATSPIVAYPEPDIDYCYSTAGDTGFENAWTNTTNISTSNNQYAVSVVSAGYFTELLVATKFDLGIPAGVTILAIEVRIEVAASTGGVVQDYRVELIVGGILNGLNAADGSNTLTVNDDGYRYVHTPTAWGYGALTISELNADNFGVAIQYANTSGSPVTVSADAVSIAVYFTPSGSSAAHHSIVRLRKGLGDYYIFEEVPWMDFFRRTNYTDEEGYIIAFQRYYDQNTQRWYDGQETRLQEGGGN